MICAGSPSPPSVDFRPHRFYALNNPGGWLAHGVSAVCPTDCSSASNRYCAEGLPANGFLSVCVARHIPFGCHKAAGLMVFCWRAIAGGATLTSLCLKVALNQSSNFGINIWPLNMLGILYNCHNAVLCMPWMPSVRLNNQ